MCIPSEASRLDDIEGAISRMRVNLAVLTPSIIGFITPSHIPTLKTLVLAGEAMSQAHLHTWSVDHNLINGYVRTSEKNRPPPLAYFMRHLLGI